MKKFIPALVLLAFVAVSFSACFSLGSGGNRIERDRDTDAMFALSKMDNGWLAVFKNYVSKDETKRQVAIMLYGFDMCYDKGRAGDLLAVGMSHNDSEGLAFYVKWDDYDKYVKGKISSDTFADRITSKDLEY
jgi:hypothetical protein